MPVAFGMMKIGEDDATFQSMPESARQFWIEFDQKVKPSICEALLERYLPYAAEKLSLIFGEEAEHLKSQLEPKEFRSVRGSSSAASRVRAWAPTSIRPPHCLHISSTLPRMVRCARSAPSSTRRRTERACWNATEPTAVFAPGFPRPV